MITEKKEKGRPAAIIAYLSIVGFLIAIFINMEDKHRLASFHLRQALGTHLIFYFLGALASMFSNFYVPTAFYLTSFIIWIFGLLSAIQGEFRLIPYIGVYFQKWFKSIT